jgi:2'-5' RNA ligase
MEPTLYDIVLLPSDELAQKLIAASRSLATQALFTLDGTSFYPHVSLYMVQLKSTDLEKVKVMLSDIASDASILDLTASKYNQTRGYFDVEYERTEWIDTLQQTVIDAINPMRDGMNEEDALRMQEATGLARENLEKYGYKPVGELFRPHATITRFANEGTTDITVLPDLTHFSGQYTRIGLFEMGDSGTCIREIASYNLV